jgi:hypothetical protein
VVKDHHGELHSSEGILVAEDVKVPVDPGQDIFAGGRVAELRRQMLWPVSKLKYLRYTGFQTPGLVGRLDTQVVSEGFGDALLPRRVKDQLEAEIDRLMILELRATMRFGV